MLLSWTIPKLQTKKKNQKEKANIDVTVLEDSLMDSQVKLIEFDNRSDTKIAEYEAGELLKSTK